MLLFVVFVFVVFVFVFVVVVVVVVVVFCFFRVRVRVIFWGVTVVLAGFVLVVYSAEQIYCWLIFLVLPIVIYFSAHSTRKSG